MKVSYNWLQKYFIEPLPQPSVLAEALTVHTFEVEEMQERGDDTIFEVKVLPDRAHYLLSHKGVAREVSVVFGLSLQDVHGVQVAPVSTEVPGMKVVVDNAQLCKRYMAQEINNVKTTASPSWLKSALENLGQKSINTVVDAGNYIMFDVGQPLHAFDADKIDGAIRVRNAVSGEKIILLTDEEAALTPEDLVIADDRGPLAIAGVKGGKRAGVTLETKRLILEAANFDPATIRKTATRLNLRNDSSKRFENEITPALAEEARTKFLTLLKELCPEIEIGGVTDFYPNPVQNWSVTVTAEKITTLVGIDVGAQTCEKTLKSMGCEVVVADGVLVVTPPLDRLDILTPEDVVDEVGRIIGYEKLPAIMPPALSVAALPDKVFYYAEKAKNSLVARGYSEALLYSLVAKGMHEIVYPLASDKSALRESLLPKLHEALIANGRNADLLMLETIKICEVGKVFRAEGEKTHLAIGVLPVKKKKGVTAEFLLREDMLALEATLGTPLTYTIVTGEYGATVEIDLDEVVAQLPAPAILNTLGFQPLPGDIKYQKFSPYPYIVRDVAVFVPESTSEATIQKLIREQAGPLCVRDWLFDVFVRDLPTGKRKSCAFRLVFQSFERTLEDGEVNAIMETIYAKIATQSEWEVR